MRVKDKTDFITAEEAKRYIKVEHDQEDGFIKELITIAQEQADNFLQNEFREQKDGEWVDLPIPFSIKLACLKMIAAWYETRGDDVSRINAGGVTIELGDIPWDSARLLYPYKKLVGL
jgi:uncharacterized phage protein (predicted DNA packaging)